MATKYTPFFAEYIIFFMKDGKTFTEFAADVGVSVSTLHNWRKKYAEFDEACSIAVAQAQAHFEKILRKSADGTLYDPEDLDFKKYAGSNRHNLKFLMSARFSEYRDKVDIVEQAAASLTPWDSISISVTRNPKAKSDESA